jgi:hypothetical protein
MFTVKEGAQMAIGPMQFGADNNAGPTRPNQTILRSQNTNQETLVVRNEPAGSISGGGGLTVEGGPFAVKATGGHMRDQPGTGVHAVANQGIGVHAVANQGRGVHAVANGGTGVIGEGETGVFGNSTGTGSGVWGRSPQQNGVQGVSGSYDASGVYGENTAGGYGIAGRTFGRYNDDRAAVLGESLRDPGTPAGSQNGKAPGVYGYSETGYGGVFITGQAYSASIGVGVAYWPNSGGLRVVGNIVKTKGEYSEALPHPDGSQRLLYAPMSPESWFEDYGRAQLVGGRVEVELDTDFVAVLGIEDGEYHVFLTPEGDTQGLYVESRSARSFIVREQQAGTSNTTFSYRVAAKNKHRQPERLAILEEPEELTKPRETPSRLTSDQPDPLV